MECLGIIVAILSPQLCVMFCLLYRESDCGANKEELMVFHEVSEYQPYIILLTK